MGCRRSLPSWHVSSLGSLVRVEWEGQYQKVHWMCHVENYQHAFALMINYYSLLSNNPVSWYKVLESSYVAINIILHQFSIIPIFPSCFIFTVILMRQSSTFCLLDRNIEHWKNEVFTWISSYPIEGMAGSNLWISNYSFLFTCI